MNFTFCSVLLIGCWHIGIYKYSEKKNETEKERKEHKESFLIKDGLICFLFKYSLLGQQVWISFFRFSKKLARLGDGIKDFFKRKYMGILSGQENCPYLRVAEVSVRRGSTVIVLLIHINLRRDYFKYTLINTSVNFL